jgi:hypothetical protein
MVYAADSSVPVERSRQEIEKTLARFGADQFGYATGTDRATVCFRARGRMIRFDLPLPPRERLSEQQHAQRVRSAWRCLVLSIKAKLAAVESAITSFEQEFMPYTVMPDGRTAAQHALPLIEEAYQGGKVAGLLPHFQ